MTKPALFIFGLGYVGQHFAQALKAQGWRVGGTTRSASQAELLNSQGFEAVIWDGASPLPLESFKGASHYLITIPPDDEGDPVFRWVDFEGVPVTWLGYVSSTAVYGDHQGLWVTETSALNPTSSRGKQRCMAESQWLGKHAEDSSFPIHIFRLSGIYGPGRSVLDRIHAGTAERLDKPGHVFSRIHIEDIVGVLEASVKKPQPGEIYNLADDEPASTADVIAYGCALLGIEVPPLIPFEEENLSPMLREFYADNKRVSNEKMKTALGVNLKYPTYREGLKALIHPSV